MLGKWKVKAKSLSRVRHFATPWTATYQASPPMGFSRQEYRSGVPLPSPRTVLWPSNPTAGHTHWGNQNWKRHVYPNVQTALFIIARTWKQPRCPSADKWVRKLWYINTMEYYSAIKKNTFESVLMRWMKLGPIIQSEVSQKEKHQYSILTHIYGI